MIVSRWLCLWGWFVLAASTGSQWHPALHCAVTCKTLLDDSAFTEIVTSVDPDTNREIRSAVDPVSFQWIAPVTLAVNLGVGTAISWVLSRRRASANR